MNKANPVIEAIRLTQYSHGAGCGCKIAPALLDQILQGPKQDEIFKYLLVGNESKDDAAVMDLGDGTAIISTTDFFMPIVDDPISFGKIAATNAISDIYAMGGTPLMAIAILGWPINKLGPEIAGKVIEGGRQICSQAGIPLAGGHSIDSPEPIFGLAVTGRVPIDHLKQNSTAQAGDLLFLSKGLGVGILTTAQKKGIAEPEHIQLAIESMQKLNFLGKALAPVKGVHAMTDVTGFGLLGHLNEICQGSDLQAQIRFKDVPKLDEDILRFYHQQGCVRGGTIRNFDSYGNHVHVKEGFERDLLSDPQTSGGLLITVGEAYAEEVKSIAQEHGIILECFGELSKGAVPRIIVAG